MITSLCASHQYKLRIIPSPIENNIFVNLQITLISTILQPYSQQLQVFLELSNIYANFFIQ